MIRRCATLAALAAMAGCSGGGSEAPGSAGSELTVLRLAEEPSLEIGVLEGNEHYTFDQVTGVRRLPSGEIAVADGGAAEITVYGPDGAFARRWGGSGEGPEEFGALGRVYVGAGDSLLAVDGRSASISVYSADGSMGRRIRGAEFSGDETFPVDAWLFQRFWVEGALSSDERARVRRILSALPAPRSAPGYRFVRVADDGGLWIREPGATGGVRTWTILDAAGSPTAGVEVDARFTPLHLAPDELLGAWTGESDVHFVRAYDVMDSGETRTLPNWLDGTGDADTEVADGEAAPNAEEFVAEIRSEIKHMASAQEIHYSQHYTYSTAIDSLESFEPSDAGLMIDFLFAGTRGWGGVFSHPQVDRICGLAYGFTIPAGWTPGAVMCAPDSNTTPEG